MRVVGLWASRLRQISKKELKGKKKTEKHGNSDIKEGVELKTTFVSFFDTFKQIHQCIHMWQLEILFIPSGDPFINLVFLFPLI